MSNGMPNLNLMFGQKISDIKAGKFDEVDAENETSTDNSASKEASVHDKAIIEKSLAYGNNILNNCYGKSSGANNSFQSNASQQTQYNNSYEIPSFGNIFNGSLFNSSGNIFINEENFQDWLINFFNNDQA